MSSLKMIIKTASLGVIAALLLMVPGMVYAETIDAFENGGFEGLDASISRDYHNSAVPPGWTTTAGTPDVFNGDTSFAHYTWEPSSTGGDFLHCIGGSGSYTESALQVALDGLVIGEEYEISFEQSISHGDWSSGGGYWEITFGEESQTSEPMELPEIGVFEGWDWQTMIFTATDESQTLEVKALPTNTSYRADLGIDSFYLGTPGGNPDNPDTTPPPATTVPEPAIALLLGIGALATAGLRKKFTK